MRFGYFSTLNDSLLEKVHKLDASLQEVNDSHLQNANHANAENEEVCNIYIWYEVQTSHQELRQMSKE